MQRGEDNEQVKTSRFRWSWEPSEWRRGVGERDSERLYLAGNHFGVAA